MPPPQAPDNSPSPQDEVVVKRPRGTKGVTHRENWTNFRKWPWAGTGQFGVAAQMVAVDMMQAQRQQSSQMMEIMQSMQELLWVMVVVVVMFCSLGAVGAGLKGGSV